MQPFLQRSVKNQHAPSMDVTKMQIPFIHAFKRWKLKELSSRCVLCGIVPSLCVFYVKPVICSAGKFSHHIHVAQSVLGTAESM